MTVMSGATKSIWIKFCDKSLNKIEIWKLRINTCFGCLAKIKENKESHDAIR